MRLHKVLVVSSALVFSLLAGCKNYDSVSSSTVADAKLDAAIEARAAEDKSRDSFRNPRETLAFFDVGPEMRVLEVFPGGGWYTKILAPYLAPKGELYAINYADSMWPLFGFFDAENIAKRKQSMLDWPKTLVEYGGVANGEGTAFGRIPQSWNGSFDRVLMIRATHNLNRFEAKAQTRSSALSEVYDLLKPGGKVGVVQHQGPETASDDWAGGQNGYLKKSAVIEMFKTAGFVLEAESSVNNNALDNPGGKDFVWRLQPSLRGHKDDEAKQKAQAVGESNRMTLLFVKPS